jgi:cytochrome oxidase Cu insertion factor (SCO1/SenC/PrrC family)
MLQVGLDPFKQPGFLLADPLGNVILSYQGEIDPKKILSDIKKLLRASKVG